MTLRLWSMFAHRCPAVVCALSWVAVHGMLVCGCPASKGGILRAISPIGSRFRASALHVVSGRKNHDVCVHTFLCIHVHLFLGVAFRDARFLSGLSHRFSYIVQGRYLWRSWRYKPSAPPALWRYGQRLPGLITPSGAKAVTGSVEAAGSDGITGYLPATN